MTCEIRMLALGRMTWVTSAWSTPGATCNTISGLALRVQGLSRMRGNSRVRFLGGWGRATGHGYPRGGRAVHMAKGDRWFDGPGSLRYARCGTPKGRWPSSVIAAAAD